LKRIIQYQKPKTGKLKNKSSFFKSLQPTVSEKSILLNAFFNSADQYQLLLNKQLEIVAFNDCAFNFNRKYAHHDFKTGKSIFDYINPSLTDDFKMQCFKAFEGEIVHYEHFIEGGWFNFVIKALYNPDNEITGLSIVGSNVNDQKKNAKLIRQQSQSLSNIAWFQSHQLRHPVSSILALLNLIKEEHDYHLTKEYLLALETATKQLDTIINAVVQKSRDV